MIIAPDRGCGISTLLIFNGCIPWERSKHLFEAIETLGHLLQHQTLSCALSFQSFHFHPPSACHFCFLSCFSLSSFPSPSLFFSPPLSCFIALPIITISWLLSVNRPLKGFSDCSPPAFPAISKQTLAGDIQPAPAKSYPWHLHQCQSITAVNHSFLPAPVPAG